MVASVALDNSPMVLRQMKEKHPQARGQIDLASLSPTSVGLVPVVDTDDIKKAISSFSKHSGGGPSGSRPWHLKQALTAAHTEAHGHDRACHQLNGTKVILESYVQVQ